MAWAWSSAFATGLAVVYGLNIHQGMGVISTQVAAFYGGFHRAAWALALGWVIIACTRGYGGYINRFLSWGGFIPLSKISYIIYLMHFFVMYLMTSVMNYYIPGTNLMMVMLK